jgi:RNA polymerase sigma-70 factor (ECF subfamily)
MSKQVAGQHKTGAKLASHGRLADLLVAAGSGNEDAFRSLTQLSTPILRRISLSYCEDETSADDILQDALISIWRHASSFRSTHKRALPWLITITRSRAVDWLRKRTVRTRGLSSLRERQVDEEPSSPLESLLAAENEALLLASIASIDPKKRESVRLHYIEGFSVSDIAKVLGSPAPTIKSRIGRGIKEIRAAMLITNNFMDN